MMKFNKPKSTWQRTKFKQVIKLKSILCNQSIKTTETYLEDFNTTELDFAFET